MHSRSASGGSGPHALSPARWRRSISLHLLRAQLPADRLHVRVDLLRLGGARDDAADGRARREPRERELQQRVPARLREGIELFDFVEIRVGHDAGEHRHREPRAGGRGAALVLAGEQAGGERVIGQQAEAVTLQRRNVLGVEAALQQAVFVLRRDERIEIEVPRGPLRLDDLRGRRNSSSRCSAPCRRARDRRARAGSPRSG